jgi:hypothetical protein
MMGWLKFMVGIGLCRSTNDLFKPSDWRSSYFSNICKYFVLPSCIHKYPEMLELCWEAHCKVSTPKCDTCFSLGTWEGVVQKICCQRRVAVTFGCAYLTILTRSEISLLEVDRAWPETSMEPLFWICLDG